MTGITMKAIELMERIDKAFQVKEIEGTWAKIAGELHDEVSHAYVEGELDNTDRAALHGRIDGYYKRKMKNL